MEVKTKREIAFPRSVPPQKQDRQPGLNGPMIPKPVYEDSADQGSHKLDGKVALITVGDSGIGEAVAIAYAKEGPIWTPLIPSTFTEQEVAQFGLKTPLGRPGQPVELAKAYVFLASADSSYMSGQTIHINGGEIVNG